MISIVRARIEDAQQMSNLAQESKAYWGYPKTWLKLWQEELTITPAMIEADLYYCSWSREQTLIGFYGLSMVEKEGVLEHLWVKPGFMGEGAGRQLLVHAVRSMKKAGGKRLRIESDPHAEGFYRKAGAKREGEVQTRIEGRSLPLLYLK